MFQRVLDRLLQSVAQTLMRSIQCHPQIRISSASIQFSIFLDHIIASERCCGGLLKPIPALRMKARNTNKQHVYFACRRKPEYLQKRVMDTGGSCQLHKERLKVGFHFITPILLLEIAKIKSNPFNPTKSIHLVGDLDLPNTSTAACLKR